MIQDRLLSNDRPPAPDSIKRIHNKVVIFGTFKPRRTGPFSSHFPTSASDLLLSTLVPKFTYNQDQCARPRPPSIRSTLLPLTTAALFSLLLAGLTLVALLAYSSPRPSPTSVHDTYAMTSDDNLSTPVISNSDSTLQLSNTPPLHLNAP